MDKDELKKEYIKELLYNNEEYISAIRKEIKTEMEEDDDFIDDLRREIKDDLLEEEYQNKTIY